jgi:RNA polymerase sigma factor (sigma-70 family)
MDPVDALARRFQAGDAHALDALYRAVEQQLQAWIRRSCQRGLPPVLEPEDLHQQSWLILAELAQHWQPREGIPFTAYLQRVFPWALARYLRRQSPSWRSQRHAVYSWPHEQVVARMATLSAPDDVAWEDRLLSRQLLGRLPSPARAALWLHAVERRSFRDVARLLGVPRTTAYDLYRWAVAAARANA